MRRLAAIMFTDMVGYSALVQENEAGALELLDEHRRLIRPVLQAHHGLEIKTIGDAFLVEFESALDAVECAVTIQKALHERNSGADRRAIIVRIGIHVGDVIHQDGDVYGDGVNIASRIQTAAPPGGVLLSEDVARQVQNKIDLPLQRLGERDLKNISVPVQLFALRLPWEFGRPTLFLRRLPRRRRLWYALALTLAVLGVWIVSSREFTPLPAGRIAVLPLENLSADPSDEYFTDGITEELISTLARLSGIQVIARTSSMRYRHAGFDMELITRELQVGSVLVGSVRRTADRARINIRLVDAASGRVLWTEEYDRRLQDVLMVQNDVAVRVASALKIQLLEAERADLSASGTTSEAAFRQLLLGRSHLHRRTSEDVLKAVEYFRQSVAADPNYADAWTGLSECSILLAGAGYGNVPRDRAVAEARAAAMRAIELQPRSGDALAVLAYLKYRLEWDWNSADSAFAAAVALKPGDARIHEWRGLFLALRGDPRAGETEMHKAASLDPRSPSVGTGLGRVISFGGDYPRAIRHLESVVREHPDYAEGHFALGLAYGYVGRHIESIATLERAASLSGRRPIILSNLAYAYAAGGRRSETLAIKAEFDSLARHQYVSPWVRSLVFFGLGDNDTGFRLMEEALAQKEGLLTYIRAEPMLSHIRQHPRYRAIIQALGLTP